MVHLATEGPWLALLTGSLAATAGILAKVSLDQSQLVSLGLPPVVLLLLRILLFLLTLAANGCMIAVYSRALVKCATSAEASLLATGCNLSLTGLLSNLLLGERILVTWWLGATFILGGSYLIISEPKVKPE